MTRSKNLAAPLADRLCRPQRVGVFGRRGVGKTMLLTMLYREAVGGRLPGLRLAAADARTAAYLADKILQLEAGEPLPATLGETELRFHLYHQGAEAGERGRRIELVVFDYQGEHVALGRTEPIRDFLRECDAVLLCLDVPATHDPASRLQAQQEVEQMVEDYLAAASDNLRRPTALVLTKADLLDEPDRYLGPDRDEPALAGLLTEHFDMACHALAGHGPQGALFAVSSLGGPVAGAVLQPRGLDAPLTWLADALRAQDEARLHRLWHLSPHDLALLERCLACFTRRYPDDPAGAAFGGRLREVKRRRRRRRGLAALVATAGLLLGLGGYDAWGESSAREYARTHADDPEAVRANWLVFHAWHPTRPLLHPGAARTDEERLRDLDERVAAAQREARLADLRRLAADPDTDPETGWRRLRQFHADYPEACAGADWERLRQGLKARAEMAQAHKARLAFEELERAQQQLDLVAFVGRANDFLARHAGTAHEADVRRLRAAALRRLDERDFEAARLHAGQHPTHFHTRREHYQRYLERHPEGAFAEQARRALKEIAAAWDQHDFRAVRDHFRATPGDVQQLTALCRRYLAAHPDGRFIASARDLIAWSEHVSAPHEYRVVLKSGSFDRSVAATVSRGPSLSVEVEVNGVRYGPSTIVKRNYNPEWDYEMPRRVRWQLGDSVRIRVTDHYYWKRPVLDLDSRDFDPLGIRLLAGEVHYGSATLRFESDFTMPALPELD